MKSNTKLSTLCSDTVDVTIEIEKNRTILICDDLMQNKNIEFILHDGAVLRYHLHIINKVDCKQREKNITVKLIGTHADAKIVCVCKAFGKSLLTLKTVQHHLASHTKSDLLIKGAFLRASTFRCDSLVKVEKDLEHVTALQMNKNLLIGCNARVISIPKLEVESYDVQCKHGATVAQLDSENLFYLQSRGICFCDSKKLLIDSFLK